MRKLFQQLFKRNRKLTLKDVSREVQELLGDAPGPTGVSVTSEKALGITAFWNGVRIISQTIAGLPFEVFERQERGRRLAREHPVYHLLHVRPNPYMTPYTFKEIRVAHALTWGNSYAEIEYNNRDEPVALWPLLPDRTGVEVRDGKKVYWTVINGTKVYLAEDRVLHVPGLGYDGLRGYNVIRMFRDSLGLTIAANQYGAEFFGNSGRPSGVLTHPSRVDDAERKRIREEWNQLHSGLSRAQRTAVLWGGMDFKPLTMPPEEAQFLETRSLQIDEVARILNINPILLQKTEGATTWGTAIGHFLVAFGKFTIAPWLEREEDAVNWSLFSERDRGRYYAKYNMAALLRGDSKTQAEILEIERRNGVINADDWLELTDRNPLPDGLGQVYVLPLNMMPVDQMLERDQDDLPTPRRMSNRSAKKEERSLALRRRLREAHRAAFQDGVRRFTRPEVQALRRAVRRAVQDGDPVESINAWIGEFYPDHQQRIARIMRPLVEALAAVVADAAFDEVAADPDGDLLEFVNSYTENLASRQVAKSISELQRVLEEVSEDEFEPTLMERADKWEEERPSRVARDEIVRVAAGAARWAWQSAGIAGLAWRASIDACPLCQEMDGMEIPTRGYFLAEGDSVGDGTNTFVASGPIGGPPLHDGCKCDIVPR